MTLLSVTKDVCAVVGVQVPTSVFSNITGNRTMQEMLALANEMAQRIAYDTRDWTALKATATFAGDGTTTAFNLPANYKRMLLTSNVWRSTSYITPMLFVPDTDEWLNRRARGYQNSLGEWTIIGGQILIEPALATGQSAYFAYLDKNCIDLASGGNGNAFLADNDSFVLDERVLKLGMTWQWKAQKGSPYAEDMGTYGDALTSVMGRDSPSPIIVGRRPISSNARVAYPWPVPT
jgi:hypothetical protein